jgi:uncharacterized protein (TIGR00251 family)
MDVRFVVRLTPRGGTDRIDGVDETGALRVRVAAPPVDDAANHAMIRLIAEELGRSRSAVRIVAGATARRKTVVVEGVTEAAILARWPDLGL